MFDEVEWVLHGLPAQRHHLRLLLHASAVGLQRVLVQVAGDVALWRASATGLVGTNRAVITACGIDHHFPCPRQLLACQRFACWTDEAVADSVVAKGVPVVQTPTALVIHCPFDGYVAGDALGVELRDVLAVGVACISDDGHWLL